MKCRSTGDLPRLDGHDRRPTPPTPPARQSPKRPTRPMSAPVNDRPPSISLNRSRTVLSILGRQLWPKNEWGLRSRVVAGLVLLILAKITNVYVPILYK